MKILRHEVFSKNKFTRIILILFVLIVLLSLTVVFIFNKSRENHNHICNHDFIGGTPTVPEHNIKNSKLYNFQ